MNVINFPKRVAEVSKPDPTGLPSNFRNVETIGDIRIGDQVYDVDWIFEVGDDDKPTGRRDNMVVVYNSHEDIVAEGYLSGGPDGYTAGQAIAVAAQALAEYLQDA